MTIAYIMRYWPVYGGGETVTAALANELVRRGHIVHILYAYNSIGNPMPYSIDKRIRQVEINTVDNTTENVAAVATYLREHHVDMMINQWGNQQLCYEAKLLSETPLIMCWHMCFLQDLPPVTIKQKLYKVVAGSKRYKDWRAAIQLKMHLEQYKTSDRYVFLSAAYEQEFLKLAGEQVHADKVTSVANPLTYQQSYDINHYAEKKKEVLFVGRMEESHKRLSYILRIWKLIETDKSLNDWNLRIVGDGPSMQPTRHLCTALGLQRVSFEGFKPPQPYYIESSIFMMTSAFEGFPMTLVESLQNAVVPVVMDSFLALHDVITDGVNGMIVQNDDINGFAWTMKRLMKDDRYRKRLAQKGLETCQEFELGKIVDKWESLFEMIISE